MAEVKISELTSATTPLAGTETVPIIQGGVTKKVAVSEIGGGGGSVAWGDITGALPSQTDLQDALNLKQDVLTSGTNIKTINGSSILGSGNLVVGSSNPSVIDASYIDGTTVTGTTANTISQSLLIPANTFASNGMLEVFFRATKVGIVGGFTIRIYTNTTNSLTGATLVGPLLSSGTNIWCQGLRTFRVNSNLLTGLTTSTSSTQDYQGNNNTSFSTTFTTSVDNYIIIAIQLGSASDTAKVEMAKAVRYI